MKISYPLQGIILLSFVCGCSTAQKDQEISGDSSKRVPAATGVSQNRLGTYPDPIKAVELNQWLGLTPDNSLTRGAIDPCFHTKELCAANETTKGRRHTTDGEKTAAAKQYTNKFGPSYTAFFAKADKSETPYEIDHLISLEIGGADTSENLWPQPTQMATAGASDKDKVEDHAAKEMCVIFRSKGEGAAEEYLALIQRAISGGYETDNNGAVVSPPQFSWYDLYYADVLPHTDGHGNVIPNSTISFEATLQHNKGILKNLRPPVEVPSSTANCVAAKIN